jgi:hypothetical protein
MTFGDKTKNVQIKQLKKEIKEDFSNEIVDQSELESSATITFHFRGNDVNEIDFLNEMRQLIDGTNIKITSHCFHIYTNPKKK